MMRARGVAAQGCGTHTGRHYPPAWRWGHRVACGRSRWARASPTTPAAMFSCGNHLWTPQRRGIETTAEHADAVAMESIWNAISNANWPVLLDVVRTLATLAGVGVAIWGVNKWRREQVGKRQCELAEDTLAIVYEAQSVFDHVRSPMSFEGEGSSRRAEAAESPQIKAQRDQNFIPLERLQRHESFFERVVALQPRVRAVLGRKASEPLAEILKMRSDIVVAARMLSHFSEQLRDELDPEVRRSSRPQREQHESTKWKLSDDDDIDRRIRNATARLEQLLEPVLRSRYRT